MASYLDDGRIENCSGCGACQEICPPKCIHMEQGEDGFLFPKIDESMCVHCGKCRKICLYNSPVNRYPVLKSFSGASTRMDIRKNCSSGGIFGLLAEHILSNQGIVAGAVFNQEYKCVHFIAHNEKELFPMLGSKYVQSECSGVFPEIKKSLREGMNVLFSGTPCQVAGLRNYLGRTYSNLCCVDIACHGTPSAADFEKCKMHIEKKHNGNLVYIKFRDKKHGGWYHSLSYTIEKNGVLKEFTAAPYKIPYYYLFLQSMNIRKSCYRCPYVGLERTGDITLADYWRAEKSYKEGEIGSGVSAVMCNTEKGVELLMASVGMEQIKEANLNDLIEGNQPFLSHIAEKPCREKRLKGILKNGYRGTWYYIGMRRYVIAAIKASIPEKVKRKILRHIGV